MNTGGPPLSARKPYLPTSRARKAAGTRWWASDYLIVLGAWESQVHGEAGSNLRIVRGKHGLHSVGEKASIYKDRNKATMRTGLERITQKAKEDANCCFTSLTHHITPELLGSSLQKIANASSAGVDREEVSAAKATFDCWKDELLSQVHHRGYKPPPVKRVYIPKPGKKENRAIGIPTVRDRVLQRSVSQVLSAIYEADFLECSHGGRLGCSAHHAVSTVKYTISSKKVSWVYEADLKNFFGSLDHGWLMRFVLHRVKDPRILTLIRRWLKAGVVESGVRQETACGTPQGGSISVLLSNIYMHYVLDLWFEKRVKPRLKGEAYLCRYLDDFVVCFQLKQDAIRFQEALSKRLAKFKLELEPSKTSLIPFGRFAKRDCEQKGQKAPTFEFLGFTFYGVRCEAGNYVVGLKTAKSRLNRGMATLKTKLVKMRHLPLALQAKHINMHLRGHYQYFGVPFNSRALVRLHRYAIKIWRKTLGRRSQKGRLTWRKYSTILQAYPLAKPKLKYTHLSFQLVAKL